MATYIHKWRFRRRPDDEEWGIIEDHLSAFLTECPETAINGLQLRDKLTTIESPKPGFRVIVRLDHSDVSIGHTDANGVEVLEFNGYVPFEGDSFVLRQDTQESSAKTYRQPYDDLVMASLILIESKIPGLLEVSGTAGREDWLRGLSLLRKYHSMAQPPPWISSQSKPAAVASIPTIAPGTLDFRV